jgi:hypothetical protein
MGIFSKLFGKKENPINSYDEFWAWFQQQASQFHRVVKNPVAINEGFFRKIYPKLTQLNPSFQLLAGMIDENTAELVFTADGIVKYIPLIEEIVAAAPAIPGWRFVALKPEFLKDEMNVVMDGQHFNSKTIRFCTMEDAAYPDQISIGLVHSAYQVSDHELFANGCLVFIDNYLGELNAALQIDHIEMLRSRNPQQETIAIDKLPDYLKWRQSEFVEKYQGTLHDSSDDNFGVLDAKLSDGSPLVAVLNKSLLDWDAKASHPWVLTIMIQYPAPGGLGMPEAVTADVMARLEEEIEQQLSEADGYLNVARQTAQSQRVIFFACREFRKPAKVMAQIVKKNLGKLTLDYDIFKDPYWRAMSHLGS